MHSHFIDAHWVSPFYRWAFNVHSHFTDAINVHSHFTADAPGIYVSNPGIVSGGIYYLKPQVTLDMLSWPPLYCLKSLYLLAW